MSRVFIVAEAGSNFRAGPRDDGSDLARALALIDIAADAGADCCKFQFWSDAAKVYAPGAGPVPYLAARGDTRDIGAIFDDLRLPAEWLPRLAGRCNERGIEFMASVFHPDDVPIVDPYVKRHKIASYEMGYEALVRRVATTAKPMIMSTGAHTEDEVWHAVEWIDDEWRDSVPHTITLMQCCAAYPAPNEALGLDVIRAWTDLHAPGLQVGYSDHSPHWWTPIAAVALGATVIEKHFTQSRRLAGPDHAFALEPDELRQMVAAVRETEAMLGDGVKRVMPAEEPLRAFAVRHVQAIRDLKPGDPIIEGETVACLRPGNRSAGAWAGDLGQMRGKRLRVAVGASDGVRMEDVE